MVTSNVRHLVNGLRAFALAAALTAPLAVTSGCAATPAAAEAGLSADTGPDGPGLTTHILADKIVLYAMPPSKDAKVVDYVIIADKSKDIVLHVENASNLNNFRLELERSQLPKGLYHMKVYVDKATEPFDEKDIETP